jgi:hypothetical protein
MRLYQWRPLAEFVTRHALCEFESFVAGRSQASAESAEFMGLLESFGLDAANSKATIGDCEQVLAIESSLVHSVDP